MYKYEFLWILKKADKISLKKVQVGNFLSISVIFLVTKPVYVIQTKVYLRNQTEHFLDFVANSLFTLRVQKVLV